LTKPANELQSCILDDGRWGVQDPTHPPNYGTNSDCLAPDVNTLIQDARLAGCCDQLHSIYTESADNWYSAQAACFTKKVLGEPTQLPTPEYGTYIDTVYKYDGGFTTLCDGVPRATTSAQATSVIITTDTTLTGLPTITQMIAYGDISMSQYAHPRPSCTVAPKACFKLFEDYSKDLRSMADMMMTQGEIGRPSKDGSLSSVDASPSGADESSMSYAEPTASSYLPNCRNFNPQCPPERALACPAMGGVDGPVDLLVWPQDSFAVCGNASSALPTLVSYEPVTFAGYTLHWPTNYVLFKTLTEMDTAFRDPRITITSLLPTYTSVILPAHDVDVQIPPTIQMVYDAAVLGTSTDSLRPTASVPMVPWPIYSAYKSAFDAAKGKTSEIPRTIYHDTSNWVVRVKVSREEIHAIDPCWSTCDAHVIAPDPPGVLPRVEGVTELPVLVVPSHHAPTKAIPASALPVQSVDVTGNQAPGNQAPANQPEVQSPLASLTPTAPVDNGVPIRATLFATRSSDSFEATALQGGQGNPVQSGQTRLGANSPLQVAITPTNGNLIFTATAVDAKGSTFVAQGTTFSVGGTAATVNGVIISADPGGAVVVSGAATSVPTSEQGGSNDDSGGGRGGGDNDGKGQKKNHASVLLPMSMAFSILIVAVIWL
jgi:hypothetical protein